jgi:hypothetical protein
MNSAPNRGDEPLFDAAGRDGHRPLRPDGTDLDLRAGGERLIQDAAFERVGAAEREQASA